jgi:2-oxoglutarate ferredoxin oxidoreductase subunit gamma
MSNISHVEIRVAGYGGQGVITAGYVLAYAATIHRGLYGLMTQSYGPEARGGACRSDVILSKKPIEYPKLTRVDYLVALSLDAYSTFIDNVRPKGAVIHEASLVKISEAEHIPDLRYYPVAAIEAAQELGNPLAANMVMLGAVQALTDAIDLDALKKTVEVRFPRFKRVNFKALEKGVEIVSTLL